jgi:hypothetical protein
VLKEVAGCQILCLMTTFLYFHPTSLCQSFVSAEEKNRDTVQNLCFREKEIETKENPNTNYSYINNM